jgi:plastocyanin
MPTTHFFVVGSKSELADVIVMLKGVGKSTGASAAPVTVDQKGCLYSPQIFAVQTGQKIMVKNSDPVMHNIHAVPAVDGNAEQNVPQMQGAGDITLSFDKPENFLKFKCDVHNWMFAWVTVVDSPYYAVTDKDGKFTIKNVPAGDYTIVALHRKAAPTGVEQKVTVTADGGKADFTLEVK